ncbi:MAG TPA: enhanced serine sensitivity protein SseB C-terminal domain-containing protein [Blastocatellia bacterium]|nr:enhanced serine sensitivity protein SseB C-terminal domain-containing protein [Blastocatellia bacterium]
MAFEPQNDLEQSLMRAATDPAHRPQFYRDFLESDIFVIQAGPPDGESGPTTLESGYQLRIESVKFNGKDCLPIFSSLPRLQAVLKSEATYLALNAREFLKITSGADLVLNPGSPYGKEFTAAEIASLLDGSIWKPSQQYVAEENTQVMLGQPARYPEELVSALKRLFNNRYEVKRAWLAHYYNPKQAEKAHTLIAIETVRNFEQVASEAGIVANNVNVPDPPIDFVQITGKGGFEDYFLKSVEPFYKRSG